MQLAQSGHAIAGLALSHSAPFRRWHDTSNNLVVLAAYDEIHLADLVAVAYSQRIEHRLFREPDLDNELTSVAMLPTTDQARHLSSLPLAGAAMA